MPVPTTAFSLGALPTSNWFPGHMHRALRLMEKRIVKDRIGLLLEVRDVRAPFACINWKFEKMRLSKIIVYNKCDTLGIDIDKISWTRKLKYNNMKHLGCSTAFTSVSENRFSGVDELVKSAIRSWTSSNSPDITGTYPPLTILVTGMPNTGKSSIINALRIRGLGYGGSQGRKVAPVGRDPGLTRSVSSSVKILDTTKATLEEGQLPKTQLSRYLLKHGIRIKVFVVDSPGIMPPYIASTENALKLAALRLLPVNIGTTIDACAVAEYLWWRMNYVWNIGPKVLSIVSSTEVPQNATIDYKKLGSWKTLHRLLNIIARENGYSYPSSLASSSPSITWDKTAAAIHFSNLWCSQAFLFGSWETTCLDYELLEPPENLDRWFLSNYVNDAENDSSKSMQGRLLVDKTTLLNARDRRKKLRK